MNFVPHNRASEQGQCHKMGMDTHDTWARPVFGMRDQLPYANRGATVGLLGGSFDPAHDGHVHITQTALKRFGLDQVWWLVSPGNPLKEKQPAAMGARLAQARHLMRHPNVTVTDIEAQMGTQYTAKTIQALQHMYHGVNFVWLMGADNLAQFHLWQDWRWIMDHVPVGVMARPGDRISARMSKAARVYRQAKLSGRAAENLGRVDTPAWCFINLPMSLQSSSAIRAAGAWN